MPYTPGQLVEMLDIPPSSLRRLSQELREFLSKQKGRHRRYTEQDVNVLRHAREMTGQGYSLARVKAELPLVLEEPQEKDSLSLVPSIAGELARMDDNYRLVLRELEELRQARDADRERLQRLEEELERLRQPWYKRLFKRP